MRCASVKVWSIKEAGTSWPVIMKNPTWKTEIVGLWETLISDPYIVLLFPMFFVSNFFYTYQFNGVNAAQFNTRTRALNNVLYWLFQIVGAFIFGFSLDIQSVRRSTRARIVWVVLVVITLAIWGGGYAFQQGYDRADVKATDFVPMDWTSSGYAGPMFLYIFYVSLIPCRIPKYQMEPALTFINSQGFYDAAWQTCIYWYVV